MVWFDHARNSLENLHVRREQLTEDVDTSASRTVSQIAKSISELTPSLDDRSPINVKILLSPSWGEGAG
jgi:hypothetical protein